MAVEFYTPLRYRGSTLQELSAVLERNRLLLETFLNTSVVRLESSGIVALPAGSTVGGAAIPVTGAAVLTLLLTVDTDDSGLNADTLDGVEGAGYALASHAASHRADGTDEIDGDRLDIDWNPANSTPTDVAETDDADDLSAHLKGIDLELAAAALLTKIKTVDGAGSGLDADLLDGSSSAAFALLTGATFSGIVSIVSDTFTYFNPVANSDTAWSGILSSRSRGTAASKTVVTANTSMLYLSPRGWDGADYDESGYLGSFANETWTSTAHGSYWAFATTPNGSTAAAERLRIDHDGKVVALAPLGGIGYGAGAGGTQTQATNKTTGVTLNKVCGQITMAAGAIGAGAEATFVLTNSAIATTDVVVVCHDSVGTIGAYGCFASGIGAGSCSITVTNLSGGSLNEQIVLNFVVIKAVTA